MTLLFVFPDDDKLLLSLEDEPAKLEFSNIEGWLSAEKIPVDDLKSSLVGTTRSIQFQGKVIDAEIDGKPVGAKPYDVFNAAGDIDGNFLENGVMRLSGRADQLWKNGKRLNATKWERTGNDVKIFLISALGALILAGARILWPLAMRARQASFH